MKHLAVSAFAVALGVGLAASAPSAIAAPFSYEMRTPVPRDVLQPLSIDLLAYALPAGTVGQPYSFDFKSADTLSVTGGGGSTVFAWSLIGALPPGLTLNAATGVVSGTPTAKDKTGTPFDLQVAAGGKTDTEEYAILVNGLPLKVSQISVGAFHVCAVTLAGGVKCWGEDLYGALGNGSSISSTSSPGDVSGLTSGVVQVAAGDNHTCALLATGTVKCWGQNTNGQLGTGNQTHSQVPVNVTGLTDVVSIAAGYVHNCAVLNGGAVKCWGSDGYGQIGNGGASDGNLTSPVSVTLASGAAKIKLGHHYSCAVLDTGALQCWGDNGAGQLGTGDQTRRYAPVDVAGLTSGVTDVGPGSGHTCAVQNASVKCWGSKPNGKLGSNLGSGVQLTPIDVTSLGGATAVAAGPSHTCGITTAGAMKCWGVNAYGQIGTGATGADVTTATDVMGLSSNVTAISAGTNLSCAIHDGTAKCWGQDYSGQIGDGGTNTDQPAPTALEQN